MGVVEIRYNRFPLVCLLLLFHSLFRKHNSLTGESRKSIVEIDDERQVHKLYRYQQGFKIEPKAFGQLTTVSLN